MTSSTIVVTGIDVTKPEAGNATTQSVRDNFSAIYDQFINAKADINAIYSGSAFASTTFTLINATALTATTFNNAGSASFGSNVYIKGDARFYGGIVPNTALSAGSTTGHMYVPAITGTPTGTPAAKSGAVALMYDKSADAVYFFNSAWTALSGSGGGGGGGGIFTEVTASYNLYGGQSAGSALIGGTHNVIAGTKAGRGLTSGGYNILMGAFTGYNLNTGHHNTIIGHIAGYLATTANFNTIVGASAGYSLSTGNQNTFVGGYAGKAITTGTNNVFVGMQAYNNGKNSGTENIGVGHSVLSSSQGSYNTIVGRTAGGFLDTTYNIGIGYQAVYGHTTLNAGSGHNIGIGYRALYGHSTAAYNVMIGDNAGGSGNMTGAAYNVAFGHSAGAQLTTGSHNVLIGPDAGNGLTSQSYNLEIANKANKIITGTFATATASQSISIKGVVYLQSYAVASLPSAATAAGLIYVSDETGGATLAFSDGTNWRRVQDRAVVA